VVNCVPLVVNYVVLQLIVLFLYVNCVVLVVDCCSEVICVRLVVVFFYVLFVCKCVLGCCHRI